ncbi:uncharacterized protein LOC127136637 [Lathyrus oleraceus]|uniref:uncharacterized protein LOC127136637 n=1 Tax=Pisum sativum TaxID=3888 RepID=UPI0021CE32D4|nr:uncharacterized protein LOC127136637 [Pisum sativum]
MAAARFRMTENVPYICCLTLLMKNLVHTRVSPAIPKELLWWYKSDHHCAFYQGAPSHDIENCVALKAEVIRLMQIGILSFEDFGSNVQANLLPKYGGASVNMHDHVSCHICSRNPRGCPVVKRYLKEMLDQNLIQIMRDKDEDEHDVNVIIPHFNIPEPVVIASSSQKSGVSPLVIHLTGPTPYESDRAIPYKKNSTMLEDGKEVRIPSFSSVTNIVDVSDVIRSGQVSASEAPKRIEDASVESHIAALHMLLEKTYMDHDVTIGQLDGIVSNITACNNLSFSDEKLLEQGRNHNLALHISMNYQEHALSNVLVDIGSYLNVMPKSTMYKLSYPGAPMRFIGIIVNAFDGLKKTVIGELSPGSSMDLRSWSSDVNSPSEVDIYEKWKVGDCGCEHAILVSHLSLLLYIDADEVVGTPFQALYIINNAVKKNGESMTYLKDTRQVVENGQSVGWGQVVELAENKNIVVLGFSPGSTHKDLKCTQEVFHSVGFIHSKDQSATAILEDDQEQEAPIFVTHEVMCQNWNAVDVLSVTHLSK